MELKNQEEKKEEDEKNPEPKEEDVEICECNVRCIENCQSIQLGVEDLPVTHLEKNKYMIETYEEATVTCHQSCYDNLTKLGCEVNVQ